MGICKGNGEQESIELCGQQSDVEALIMDDHLAFVTATRLGLNVCMLPDLVVELVSRERLTGKLGYTKSNSTALSGRSD
jgi:predicted nucleic acid-binding protein